jgi:predicted dehydrogenase
VGTLLGDSVIRLGLIGAGTWGRCYVAAAHESGAAVVTHIAGDYHGGGAIVPSRQWRKLLDAPVDAFVVATPPEVREEIALELIARGRPLMLEKPITLTLESTARIFEAARAKVPVLVNHVHLFAPAYEELRARVLDWSPAFAVLSSGGSYGPERSYSALWDYGPHDVAMFLGLADNDRLGEVVADRLGGHYQVAVVAGEKRGFLRVWNDAPKSRFLAAVCAHGRHDMIVYDDLMAPGLKLSQGARAIAVSPERPLTRAVRMFARAVSHGESDWRFDPALAIEVTKILALAEQSAATKTKES